jgi:hypothetical protein
MIMAALLASGCAGAGHGGNAGVRAVVEEEGARQAAAAKAADGATSETALKAGADAATQTKAPPPT